MRIKGDMKQVPSWGPTSIRRHPTKFILHDDLALGIQTPLAITITKNDHSHIHSNQSSVHPTSALTHPLHLSFLHFIYLLISNTPYYRDF
jgi:hypothetical protein